MKKIILASGSVQRKKLLKFFGFPFSIEPSGAEEIQSVQTTCATLVKKNALIKAQDIAAKHKDGIIIGADTVVFADNKHLILKPKTLKEAKTNLKKLFTKPQWVYTGVAVIDAGTGKTATGYEKTKVFMTPLTDKEIDRYHQLVPPFDKAGGFDIEGWGSIFIRRIEGCYTNVIGLPMAKTAELLRQFGVTVLSVLIVVMISGCTSEFNLATQQEERFIYSEDKEIRIGAAAAEKIEDNFKVNMNVEENERVERILDKIVAVCDRNDIVYFIKIIDEDKLNAVSLPGGYIYIFQGLLDHIENDDQLAGVIAHEVAHITARHGIKRLQSAYGALLLQVAALEGTKGRVSAGLNFALTSLFMEYSQKAEFEADQLGVKYMTAAGYDPNQMVRFLEILKEDHDKEPLRQYSYWRTHPHIPQRIAVVNKEIKGEMGFREYLILTGEVN